jgi:hypothetical protein
VCTCMCGGRGRGGVTYVAAPLVSPCVLAVKGLVTRHRLCVEHGTLEDRGEARMRGCKSGREGEWGGICGRGEGCGRRLLATVYGARDARAHIARAVAADAPGPGAAPRALRRDGSRARAHIARAVAADAPSPGAAPHTLLRDGSRARAHIARAAAADAPGPGAAPCTPQRDGSGAPTTRRLVPVMFFSSAPTGGSSAPSASSESMAPVTRTPRGDGVGCCSRVRSFCHRFSVTEFSFFNRITVGDTKGWGQFSRVEPKRILT